MPDGGREVDAAVLGGRANVPNSATSTSTALDAVIAISGIKDVDTAGGKRATKAVCHKLHSAISPPILRRFSRSQWLRKALEKTFQSVPVTPQSNQYWPRY